MKQPRRLRIWMEVHGLELATLIGAAAVAVAAGGGLIGR
jgi:hypothetical protein